MRHVPVRSCLGCGRRDAKQEMLRIVRCGDALRVDPPGTSAGRGGYLHRHEDCWRSFGQRKGIIRSLGVPVERTVRTELVRKLRQGVEQ